MKGYTRKEDSLCIQLATGDRYFVFLLSTTGGRVLISEIAVWLDRLVLDYSNYNISSLAVPLLGCGLGGLKSKDVVALLEDKLGSLPIEVHVYV